MAHRSFLLPTVQRIVFSGTDGIEDSADVETLSFLLGISEFMVLSNVDGVESFAEISLISF